MSNQRKFWNRPTPREAPSIPYQNEVSSNPVVRGYALLLLATLLKAFTWLQGILWRRNKFHKLKEIPTLSAYEARYDPTVIPIVQDDRKVIGVPQLCGSWPRKDDMHHYTAADYHQLYKNGKLTPLQVVESLLPLITRSAKDEAPDRHAVAFVEVRAELALAAARASTERYKNEVPLSVLDGVPVAVKDEVDLEGYSKFLGSQIDFTHAPAGTAWCVSNWQEAGAIVIGKTNMHEVGLDTTGFNSTWGTPLNPYNESYYTGGSSSGSACAVAQGLCPIALGADGGGSIRLPAAHCGLYGLKPSHGRVSGRPTIDLASSVGVYGPIASDPDDLAIAYRIMAQPDPDSRTSASFPDTLGKSYLSSNPNNRTGPKLFGVDWNWISRSDPLVIHAFEAALVHYAKLDYKVVDISIPYLAENQKAHALTILSEVKTGISDTQLPKLSYHNQVLLTVAGSQASTQDFLAAQRLRNMMMQHLAWLWDKYPGLLVLTPTSPTAGWKITHPSDVAHKSYGVSDGNASLRSMEYAYLANWTGAPAITMPMTHTEDEIRVGLMAMAEWGAEEDLILFAREGFITRRPQSEEGCWVDVIGRAGQQPPGEGADNGSRR